MLEEEAVGPDGTVGLVVAAHRVVAEGDPLARQEGVGEALQRVGGRGGLRVLDVDDRRGIEEVRIQVEGELAEGGAGLAAQRETRDRGDVAEPLQGGSGLVLRHQEVAAAWTAGRSAPGPVSASAARTRRR